MDNRQQQKIKVIKEDLVEIINSMDPESKSKYMKKLAIRMSLAEDKMKKLKAKEYKFANVKKYRELTIEKFSEMFFSHVVGGFAAGGVIGDFIENSMVTCAEGDVVVPSIAIGALAGIGLSVLNCGAYVNKPLSNAVNDIRSYFCDKRIKRLEANMELDQIIVDGIAGVPCEQEEYSK